MKWEKLKGVKLPQNRQEFCHTCKIMWWKFVYAVKTIFMKDRGF